MDIIKIRGVLQYMEVAMALGFSVVGLMIYAIIVGAVRDTQTKGGLAYNIANSGLNLFSGITSQFSTIGTLTGVLILAGVVLGAGIGGYALYNKASGKDK